LSPIIGAPSGPPDGIAPTAATPRSSRPRRTNQSDTQKPAHYPLKSENRTVGVLVVQSYSKEFTYTDQDKELLAFVGQHIGAALSRARAIEETRQRNTELALINSVQEALAGELELQTIYDVVGDQIREVFDAQVVDIAIYDESTGLLHFPYTIERGVRSPDEPIELIGFRRHVMETRETLLIDEDVARAAATWRGVLAWASVPE
jgi:GAF domain-containing protein